MKKARLDELPKLAPTARHLYFEAENRPEPIETELERRFFAGLRLRSGVFKSTDAGRMGDLDKLVARFLPRDRALRLMDVAVSSGVTTADWMANLDQAGIEHTMLASDLCIEAWLLSLGRSLHVLVDRTGYPLQYDLLNRGVRTSSGKAPVDLPLAFLRSAARGWALRQRAFQTDRQAHSAGRELSAPRRAESVSDSLRRVLLISRRLATRSNLSLLEEDLLAPALPELANRFHAVRAANILSRSYFTDQQLRGMIHNLRSRLLPRGILIVCRTEDDGTNNAALFRRGEGRGFDIVGKLRNGTDIEDLVLEE